MQISSNFSSTKMVGCWILLITEHLVPKGSIAACNGKEITFVDGTKEEFDLVIMSTGYKDEYPYLPEQYANKDVRHRYKFNLFLTLKILQLPS